MQGWRHVIGLVAALAAAAAASSDWQSGLPTHYDAVVLGTGLKESLISGVLASRGKRVLQLDRQQSPGGDSATLDLSELYERLQPGEKADKKLGAADDYSFDLTPKVLLGAGDDLQLLVASGLWSYMDFRRVHANYVYRLRPDGKPDVHRVLSKLEDVLKTRMLPAVEKAKAVQLFTWLDHFDESKPETYTAGRIQKKRLNLQKMSAAAFFRFWEMSAESVQLLVGGMGCLPNGSMRQLKSLTAIDLVRAMKRYKESYKTFPHMTSPYVYPCGGLGKALPEAAKSVVEAAGGACVMGRPVDELLFDDATGKVCGVLSDGVRLTADCVVAGGAYAGAERLVARYQTVRLYALLNHVPNMCKDAHSFQLILPSSQLQRKTGIFLFSSGAYHRLAPNGKWLVALSARVEGETDGFSAMEVAKRELAAALPLLKPARKMWAELGTYCEPRESDDGLHVLGSCDESTMFSSLAADVRELVEKIEEAEQPAE